MPKVAVRSGYFCNLSTTEGACGARPVALDECALPPGEKLAMLETLPDPTMTCSESWTGI